MVEQGCVLEADLRGHPQKIQDGESEQQVRLRMLTNVRIGGLMR